MFHGREGERARLAALIDDLRGGRSFSLLVEGPAGIGKSALLEAAVAGAGDLRVLRTQGFASEADIPFGGLLTLAAPIVELRERLPEPQARAIGAALALEPPAELDRFAVPVALVGLLGLAADEQPLLVVVDDAHWLDEATLRAVLFASRRLDAEGVGILLAARDGDGERVDAPQLDRLVLGALDDASAHAVLAEGERLGPGVAEAIVAGSGGNPLALRELPRALSDDQRAGRVPLSRPLAVADDVRAAFARQLAALPADAQRALCVAAALSTGSLDALRRALEELDLPPGALDPAVAAGLVTMADDRLAFRHPLLRAAAYHERPSTDRRAAHLALAAVTADPSRRGWHLAAAAVGPDEATAAAVDAAAEHARGRGAHAEAARAWARVAELSVDEAARARRELDAAREFAVAGHPERAMELVAAAAGRDAPPQLRATAELLRGQFLLRGGDPMQARQVFERLAAEAEEAGQPAMVAALLLQTSMAHMLSGDLDALVETAVRARDAATGVADDLALVAVLVLGEAMAAMGRSEEAEALIAAAEPLLDGIDPLSELAEVVGMGAQCSLWLERLDRAERVAARLVDGARAAGAVGRLSHPLSVLAQVHWRRGRWAAAYAAAEEAVRLARETGQAALLGVVLPPLARCEAGLGHLEAARATAAEGLTFADRTGQDATALYTLAALGFAELGAGRAEAALTHLDRAAALTRRQRHGEPAMAMFAADRIEALLRAGRRDEAVEALDELDEAAARTGGAWAHAAAARCRAMLVDDEEVEAQVALALRWHERVDMPFERARTELVLGERLRRARRRADAREPLRSALRCFERLGAEPWAGRARRELRATGGRAADREAVAVDELTAHELQVALLVAEGRTNREVGAALFLSPKTIEHHLSAIYRKLGLRSRAQLAALLSEEVERTAA